MTIKNNPYRRLGKLLNHARNYQNLSLFEVSKELDVAIPKLISIEDARMSYYESHLGEAITIAQVYALYLQVDANTFIREISMANNHIAQNPPIPAFLVKK